MASTIKVGCRLPQGIRLRVFEPGKDAFGENVLNEIGEVALAGSGRHVAAPGGLDGKDDDGVAFTDADADLWAKWLKQNEKSDLITSGAVFEKGKQPKDDPAAENEAAALASTQSQAKRRS